MAGCLRQPVRLHLLLFLFCFVPVSMLRLHSPVLEALAEKAKPMKDRYLHFTCHFREVAKGSPLWDRSFVAFAHQEGAQHVADVFTSWIGLAHDGAQDDLRKFLLVARDVAAESVQKRLLFATAHTATLVASVLPLLPSVSAGGSPLTNRLPPRGWIRGGQHRSAAR